MADARDEEEIASRPRVTTQLLADHLPDPLADMVEAYILPWADRWGSFRYVAGYVGHGELCMRWSDVDSLDGIVAGDHWPILETFVRRWVSAASYWHDVIWTTLMRHDSPYCVLGMAALTPRNELEVKFMKMCRSERHEKSLDALTYLGGNCGMCDYPKTCHGRWYRH
jgi:hypothetical protein